MSLARIVGKTLTSVGVGCSCGLLVAFACHSCGIDPVGVVLIAGLVSSIVAFCVWGDSW